MKAKRVLPWQVVYVQSQTKQKQYKHEPCKNKINATRRNKFYQSNKIPSETETGSTVSPFIIMIIYKLCSISIYFIEYH